MRTVFCAFVLVIVTSTANGDLLLDDHFDDGTGIDGVPAGWTELAVGGISSVVESPVSAPSALIMSNTNGGGGGSTVIVGNQGIDPTQPTVMTVDLNGFTGSDPQRTALFGFATDTVSAIWLLDIRRNDPQGTANLRVLGGAPGGALTLASDLGDIAYDFASSLQLTLSFDSDSFRVQTDTGFDTTDTQYAGAFSDSSGIPVPTFEPILGLGNYVLPVIISGTVTDGTDAILSLDRMTVNGTAGINPIPEPSSFLFLGFVCVGFAGTRFVNWHRKSAR